MSRIDWRRAKPRGGASIQDETEWLEKAAQSPQHGKHKEQKGKAK